MYKSVNVEEIFKINKIYTAFKSDYDSNYYFDGEYHNFWEIVIVTDGEIGVTAGSDVFVLKKGQAVIHEPMEFHRLWSEGSTRPEIIIFTFGAENMPHYSSKIFEIEDVFQADKILEDIQKGFGTADFQDVDGVKINGIKYQTAVKKLEIFILETISQKLIEDMPVKTKGAGNYAKAVSVMEENLEKNLSVSDIAKMCNMSEIGLKKTFSKYSGMGVMAYFNRLKIAEATDMLKRGISVREVSLNLGFLDQNYFSTVFKRIDGNPPSFYRK